MLSLQAREKCGGYARRRMTLTNGKRRLPVGLDLAPGVSCAGLTVVKSNCLANTHPKLAEEWHPTKNGVLRPEHIIAGSERKVWWKCPKGPEHEWQAKVEQRARRASDCPRCNTGWTLASIRAFVESLKEHLHAFTPAELYLIFQQNGLLRLYGKGKSFVKVLATGRFPKEEIEKFVNGEPSLVDEFTKDPSQTLEALEASEGKSDTPADLFDSADRLVDEATEDKEVEVPLVQTKDVLCSLGLQAIRSADEEAVEFLLALSPSPRFGSTPTATKRRRHRRPSRISQERDTQSKCDPISLANTAM